MTNAGFVGFPGPSAPPPPALALSPLAVLATISASAWPTANMAIFQRFSLWGASSYRYFNMKLDSSSGNYQVGVVKLGGAGLASYTRVMSSGVIAAPTAADLHLDLGAVILPAGHYATFVWFDNTTATTRVASNSGVSSMRLAAEVTSLTAGVPGSGTLTWSSTRILGGVSVEQEV